MTLIATAAVRGWRYLVFVFGLLLAPAPAIGVAAAAAILSSCAHAPAVGRGGPVYAISIESIDGHPTTARGRGRSICSIQVGDRVAPVWLASASLADVVSPTLLEGDAAALKAGVVIERTWTDAVIHNVTDEELAAGAAVVYVPGPQRPMIVQLRFDPVAARADRT